MTWLYKKLKSFIYRWSRRGKVGERKTHSQAKKLRMYKKVVSSVYCIKNNPVPTEIDTIVITKYGWIIIETKHLTGKLTGKTTDEQWTLSTRNHHRKMHNPIMQNAVHIQALNQSLPQYKHIPKYSVIVFDEAVSWESKNGSSLLVYRNELNKEIKQLLENKRQISTQSDVRNMAKTLQSMRKISNTNKRRHIRHVRKRQKLGNHS